MITKVYKDHYDEYKKEYERDWYYAKEQLLNKLYGFDDGKRQVAITIYEEDIKSIVTKEQFENMEYRIGIDKE